MAEVTSPSAASACMLLTGLIMIAVGILTCVWTPLELMMNERLRMTPGLPAFDWWKDIPETVLINLYVFNVTNAKRFLSGEDAKLRVEEVGPIVFKEKWRHDDVVFNGNGTMSYTVNRSAIYLPEMNSVGLNATLTVPNLAILGGASRLWDVPFLAKLALNYAMMSMQSKTLVDITLHDYLYSFRDPYSDVMHKLLPHKVPRNNLGVMDVLYGGDAFVNRVTAYIGADHGHQRFSLIEKYDGSSDIPGRADACKDKVYNASEGATYNQHMKKDDLVRYYRKPLCKVVDLRYERDIHKYGVNGYKFVVPGDAYNRTEPSSDDCYKGSPPLPDGLTDTSECYHQFPVAASFPHFLHGDPKLRTYVDGLRPNSTLHDSYVYVEPLTGIPLESRARVQSNLVIRRLSGFHSMFDRFSDTCVPLFWIEYAMMGLPGYVRYLLYFTVKVVPIGQWVFTVLTLLLGLLLICSSVRRTVLMRRCERERAKTKRNKMELVEQEVLLVK